MDIQFGARFAYVKENSRYKPKSQADTKALLVDDRIKTAPGSEFSIWSVAPYRGDAVMLGSLHFRSLQGNAREIPVLLKDGIAYTGAALVQLQASLRSHGHMVEA